MRCTCKFCTNKRDYYMGTSEALRPIGQCAKAPIVDNEPDAGEIGRLRADVEGLTDARDEWRRQYIALRKRYDEQCEWINVLETMI